MASPRATGRVASTATTKLEATAVRVTAWLVLQVLGDGDGEQHADRGAEDE